MEKSSEEVLKEYDERLENLSEEDRQALVDVLFNQPELMKGGLLNGST